MIILPNEDFDDLKLIFAKLGVILSHADYSREEQALIARQQKLFAPLIRAAKEERERQTKIFNDNSLKKAFEKIHKELKKMPTKFKDIFNQAWLEKHTRQKPNGVYEIRCSINKVPISGSGKTLDVAAEDFIRKLVNLERGTQKKSAEDKTLFVDFAEKWFIVVKKPTVKPNTYESFYAAYTTHIKPYFKGKLIKAITPMEIQPLFTKFIRQKKSKTAQTIKVLLNQIFRAAVAERIIPQNPMDGVQILKYQPKKGKALTLSEEREFLHCIKGSRYELAFAFLLFGGMRRGELHGVKVDGEFLSVPDGKVRVAQEQTIRKVPITPMLQRYLTAASKSQIKEALAYNVEMLTRYFKTFCPNHHLHELRHTFITRCQECGVSREVVSVWAGHAADKTMTSTVYTHFADDFMISEGKKVDYYNRLKA